MLVPEAPPQKSARMDWKRSAKVAVGLSLSSILICLAVLAARMYFQVGSLILVAQFWAAFSLATGAMGLVFGYLHFFRSRPSLRWPVIFITILTLAVFSAHLYVINSPASSVAQSLSGPPSQTFNDSHMTVASTFSQGKLSVTIHDTGSDALAEVLVMSDGSSLPVSAYSQDASWASPLEPGQELSASWSLGSQPGQLTVSYQDLTCYDTKAQVYGCVMDEIYYVPSAQGIIAGEQCAPYADNCNLEHPFLAKGLMAAGMSVFGEYNDFGWRFFNVVMGTLSVTLLFILVLLVSKNSKFAYFGSLLLAADTMFFVHSSTALIDVPAVFFSLLAFVFYFWKASVWKIDNKVVSGIFMGLALLSKETAIFAALGLLCFHFYDDRSGLAGSIKGALKVFVPAGLVFVIGLQAYASLFTYAALPTFYQEIQFIFKYGGGLNGPGWTDGALGGYITPLNWLMYYTPVSYLVVSVPGGTPGNQLVTVGFYGVANPIIVWLVFAWVPLVLVRALQRRPGMSGPDPDDRAAVFMLSWFAWTYLPYILLWMEGRVTYPFYLVSIIPALAAGAAYFVTRDWFPSRAALLYLAGAFGWFFIYFPVKDFLPVYLRELIDR